MSGDLLRQIASRLSSWACTDKKKLLFCNLYPPMEKRYSGGFSGAVSRAPPTADGDR
jgi:hypothetical protein